MLDRDTSLFNTVWDTFVLNCLALVGDLTVLSLSVSIILMQELFLGFLVFRSNDFVDAYSPLLTIELLVVF